MATHRSRRSLELFQQRLEGHWHQILVLQAQAYAVVMVLWVLPVPNPVKVVAVTFHELSHALAATITGGSVIGFAISPFGAGVTFGLGGHFLTILLAGYVGSCLFGALLFFVSVRWKPASCLVAVEILIVCTAYFGWLDGFTTLFGLLSMMLLLAALMLPQWMQTFVVRVLGSACCLYAPLEVLADLLNMNPAPRILGYKAESDLVQIAAVLGLHPIIVAIPLLAAQAALLTYLIYWTCEAGSREQVRREIARKKRIHKQLTDHQKIKAVSYYRSGGRRR